jgi:hypothetical protein
MPAGRPTLYTQDLLDKCYNYIDNYKTATDDVIPSHVGLALYVGISTTCMYRWEGEENKKEFKDMLRKIKEMQHQALINGGLDSTFNAAITKLVLTKHGYHDKQDIKQHVSVRLEDLSEDEIDRKLLHLDSIQLIENK